MNTKQFEAVRLSDPGHHRIAGDVNSGHAKRWMALCLLLGLFPWFASAATYVNRVGPNGAVRDVTISSGATWTAAESPYVLEGHLTVAQGATLTIEQGVAVQVSAGKILSVSGVLQANKASFAINGAGNWLGIYLSPDSGDSVLDGCAIANAGADNMGYINNGYRRAAIYVNNCAPTIQNCTISSSASHGIELWPNGGTIRNNVFQDIADGYYAIVFDRTDNSPMVAGCSASGSGYPGIYVPAGAIASTNRWYNPGASMSYYWNGSLTVNEGAKLIVDAGANARTSDGAMYVFGTLQIAGTALAPVTFTSRNATQNPGDWFGFYFGSTAGDSTLSHVTVAYAGRDNIRYAHNVYRLAALYIDSCSPALDNITVLKSFSSGIDMYAGSPQISNATIQDCGWHGLKAEAGSRPSINGAAFINNGQSGGGYYVVGTDASATPNPSNVTFTGNRLQGIQIWGGTIGSDAQWKNWAANAPYVVTANVTVNKDVTLDIESGTVLKWQNSGLYVGGVLHASGDTAPIVFSSWKDDTFAGDTNGDADASKPESRNWKGIYFSGDSAASLLNNCVFKYAGSDNLGYIHNGYRLTTLYVDGADMTITNCSIANSGGHGIELWPGKPVIKGNRFSDTQEGWYAMVYDTVSNFPEIGGNSASGTGFLGIYIPEGTVTGTNRLNNPGTNILYYTTRGLTVAADSQLILDPGVNIRTAGGWINIYGTLTAQGTAATPISFASRNSPAKAGDWYGIYLGGNAGNSSFKNVSVLDAGKDNLGYYHNVYRMTALYIDSCSPALENITVSNSLWNGIELYASSPPILNASLSGCGRHGLKAEAGSRPVLSNVTFADNGYNDNGYFTIGMDASSVPDPTNVTFSNNRLQGIQVWGGTMDQATLWKAWNTNVAYFVTANVAVNAGVDLTIEQGTAIKFSPCGLYVYGTIRANGDPKRIYFTSGQDDTVIGDSNGDGTNSVATAGDWRGIYLSPASGDSVFNKCTLRYAGRDNLGYYHNAYRYVTIYVDSCSPAISNSVISDSSNQGVEIFSSSARIQNNEISNIAGFPIFQDTLDSNPAMSGNSLATSGQMGTYLPSGTITTPIILRKTGPDFPYLLAGNLTIADGVTVTVEPGVTVKTLKSSGGMGIYVYGTLNAQGTAVLPIAFTSGRDTQSPGDWFGLYFGGNAGQSVLENVTIDYAGGDSIGYIHNAYRKAAVYIDSSSPRFNHVTVSNARFQGIQTYASQSVLENSQILNCGQYGLVAEVSSRPVLNRVSFVGNGYTDSVYTVGMDATCVPDPSGMIFTTNKMEGIQIWGGTLKESGLWKVWATNAPYIVTSDTAVDTGVVLTIEPGAVVKFSRSYFYIYGNLMADGDPATASVRLASAPKFDKTGITFTSWKDDGVVGDTNGDGTNTVAAAGDWKGLYLSPASGDSVINRCLFRYAGGDSLGYINNAYRYDTIYVNQSAPTITDSAFEESGRHGVELFESQALVSGNTFSNMYGGGYALVLDTPTTFPVLADNTASGEGSLGTYVPGGAVSVSGTWNKAGTNFPYYITGDFSIADGSTLRIEPGALIQSGRVGIYVGGTLQAIGTAGEHIVFSSRNATPAPGDWKGIYFGANAGQSILQFCDVQYAGADSLGYFENAYRRAALYVSSSSPAFSDLTVSRNAAHGIMLSASGSKINSSLFFSNDWSALFLFNGGEPMIQNNTIARSQDNGIYCSAGSPRIANNIIYQNKNAGIRRDGGNLSLINNCVFNNAGGDFAGVVQGNNNFNYDPSLANPDAGDYRLTSASQAVNAGDSSNLTPVMMDLDGHLRVQAQSVDLGAYEFGAPPAQHGIDALIKKAVDANYIGAGLFDIEAQTVQQSAKAGVTTVFHVKFNYSGNLPDQVRVIGKPALKGWIVQYFNAIAGGVDITSDVVLPTGWLSVNLNPGDSLAFRIEMTADKTVPGNSSQSVPLEIVSLWEPTRRDAVRAMTLNAPQGQPDMAIARAEDIRYLGEGIINNTGLDQTKLREVDSGETAVFRFEVRNLGNIPDPIRIQGSASAEGWTVRYFDSLVAGNDVTAFVAGAGWTNTTLPLLQSYEFRAEIVASEAVPGGSIKEWLLTAFSAAEPGKIDAVKARLIKATPSATPQGGVYTLDADFEKGMLVGVEYQTVHNQLQLSKESVTLPFIWVPNSNEGTVSKVDTRTGNELGRYRVGPAHGQPSRTTVDQQGNCWVANRQIGTVVKIGLYENGQYEDRNGNGIIETSQDKNNDGVITGDELLPFGQDECVLAEVAVIPGKEGTFPPGVFSAYANDYWNPGPRGIAVDAKGNVWIGTHDSKKFYYLDGATAQILKTNDVSSLDHTSYGAVIDANGILWSSGNHRNHVLRLDPTDDSMYVIPMGHWIYGIGIDTHGNLLLTGASENRIDLYNIATSNKVWTANAYGRGIMASDDGDVWTPSSEAGNLTRYSSNGVLKATIPVGPDPTGVSIDSAGKVWVVMNGNSFIKRIDPATSKVDLEKSIPGTVHYGYSDMTGIISRTATTRFGRWTATHNARVMNTPWGTVTWNSYEPQGTSIKVRVRSSNDLLSWSLWEKAAKYVALRATPPGKYLQIEATLQVTSGAVSPILYDLSVLPSGEIDLGTEVFRDQFVAGARPEWSSTDVTTSPSGDAFLGPLGATNISLTISNLAPHSSVSVAFDLFVIGPWVGNNKQLGPDLFEINVAGGLKLLNTTFNNGPENAIADGQAYPGSFPDATHPALSGAAETNSLGYGMDSVYRLTNTFTHTASPLVLNFAAFGLDTNSAWGIANMRVFITPSGGTIPLHLAPLRRLADGRFQLRVQGENQQAFSVEGTTNFLQWTEIGAGVIETNSVDLVDPNASGYKYRFYRAKNK